MDGTMASALVLVGLGAVAAGAIGLLLPPGERLAATALALVIGAGIGVAALAIGMLNVDPNRPEIGERAFLIASALGFAGVLASLAVSWSRRARP